MMNSIDLLNQHYSKNIDIVGYSDLGEKPGFKMAMQVVDNRWYLYVAHLWQSGWSILDVTEPKEPILLKYISGPPNTWTLQIQVADNLMLTSLEKISPGWGGNDNEPYEEGIILWDVTQPDSPVELSRLNFGAKGTHRNFYAGGQYAHLAASVPGYDGNIYLVIDLSNPAHPKEVSRWWLAEQDISTNPDAGKTKISLHGPAHVEGDRAYLPYGHGGMVILDISDISTPKLVSKLDFGPDMGSKIGVHTVLPVPGTSIAVVNTEAIKENCNEPYNYTAIVDIKDEKNPRVISFFPLPKVPVGQPADYFISKGGRFGPHNQHHPQGQPHLLERSDLIYLTYFNAGIRLYNIQDPFRPAEVGCFIPANPQKRYGFKPTILVSQTEDVLVDARGFIYITDKNHGVFILREKA